MELSPTATHTGALFNLPLASIITVWLINSVEFTAEYATQVTLLLVQSGRFQTSSMSVKILRFCLTVLLSYLYLASAGGDDSRRSPLKYLKFQCRHRQKARSSSISVHTKTIHQH